MCSHQVRGWVGLQLTICSPPRGESLILAVVALSAGYWCAATDSTCTSLSEKVCHRKNEGLRASIANVNTYDWEQFSIFIRKQSAKQQIKHWRNASLLNPSLSPHAKTP